MAADLRIGGFPIQMRMAKAPVQSYYQMNKNIHQNPSPTLHITTQGKIRLMPGNLRNPQIRGSIKSLTPALTATPA
jgi:hypothetical protein